MDLQQFFSQERAKFEKQRDEAQQKLNEANAELRALDAYEAAKHTAQPKAKAPRQKGKRSEVIHLVASFPEGATRAELIEKLQIKGDKAAEQSLSNALAALKKGGQIDQLSDGRYQVPPQ